MNKKEIELREMIDLMFKEHELKMRDGFKQLIKHIDFCIDKINTKNEKL